MEGIRENEGKKMKNRTFYIFEIAVLNCDVKATRKIQIEAEKTLYKLADAITKAFGFFFDHPFGFYSDFKRGGSDSKIGFELFADLELDEGPSRPHFKGVEKVKITAAFKTVGDKMLFFFDYGENWEFSVELKEIREGENQGMKTAVIESTGRAPIQYPPCER
ncbi:MAG: hypothetical protein A2231_10430 [Candidatus Firestonebacteria bacterium RIFOXYA2_FULL_40_8]|nr:MAG: hypothetical protein A2231_10430 [Candidatus Firestonebacteria bacterium RIFOXYA2_FULL_40_8]